MMKIQKIEGTKFLRTNIARKLIDKYYGLTIVARKTERKEFFKKSRVR